MVYNEMRIFAKFVLLPYYVSGMVLIRCLICGNNVLYHDAL